MMLNFGRIAVVSTAALTLAIAAMPSDAHAFGPYPDAYGYGPVVLAPVGYGAGCGCQVYAPPPPPPPCCPPPPRCCSYGGGWYRGGGYGYGYRDGYGGGYRGGYDGY